MSLRDRELITPSPTLSSLQEISGPALIAMLFAVAIVVLDALVGGSLVFIALLAIPPVIAAVNASLPETAVVAVFSVALALLSPLWGGIDEGQRLISAAVAVAGAVGGVWVAGLRAHLGWRDRARRGAGPRRGRRRVREAPPERADRSQRPAPRRPGDPQRTPQVPRSAQ